MFDEQHTEFTLTDKVPLTEGQSYGVRLYVRGGGGGSLPVRTEQTLPSAPKTWGDAEALKRLKISDDGRTAIFSDRIPTEQLVSQDWTVDAGGPTGRLRNQDFPSGRTGENLCISRPGTARRAR